MFDVSEINFLIQTDFNVFIGVFSSLLRSRYISVNLCIFLSFHTDFFIELLDLDRKWTARVQIDLLFHCLYLQY